MHLVRPILEYAADLWFPHLMKHQSALEKVQRRITKKIFGLQTLSYLERLHFLNLHSLWWRLTRGSLINVYKILVCDYGGPTAQNLFALVPYSRTRGHPLKLSRPKIFKNPAKGFFTYRVIQYWNDLPESVVEAQNVNLFKNRLDEFVQNNTNWQYIFIN